MQRFGVPVMLLPAVIALEFGDALLIVSGAFTRLVASLLAIFCILAAVLFHSQLADGNQLLHFQKGPGDRGRFSCLGRQRAGKLVCGSIPRAAFTLQ
jgi:putative oxidoreductase